ncbi:hypothetical protein BALAC2494_01427 [Bifidobacterium animalis subsp. lactis CNCM I-2494]|uniref:Uncharacterized protein n=1 Tax=Bifidobacterium animalis subsp. lactis CNCM I-2494 TaxID=1042403 RepID=A0A806FQ09_BIFAN|nr:hypothetical protein BALAC2494_01427 [Bifidobacterium animalis subsp. lactis CNCM I-2494]KFI77616.1 hypothetical protein BPSP_3086 [Bifidobacterium pseudolongum subsp. pseudolongum]
MQPPTSTRSPNRTRKTCCSSPRTPGSTWKSPSDRWHIVPRTPDQPSFVFPCNGPPIEPPHSPGHTTPHA